MRLTSTFKKRFKLTVGVVGMVAVLTGCGLFGSEPDTRPCPTVLKLRDAARIVQYQEGEGRDLVDVKVEAGIGTVQLYCEYDENLLTVSVGVEVIVQRGPASRSSEIHLPVFVAVLNRNRLLCGSFASVVLT